MRIVPLCITIIFAIVSLLYSYSLYCQFKEKQEEAKEFLSQLNTNRKLSVVNVMSSGPVFELEGYFTTDFIEEEQLLLVSYSDEDNHKHSCEIHLCPGLFYVIEEVGKS